MAAALDLLHVSRIDHGVASIRDAALQERLVAAQTPLTVCPFSNVKLQVFASRDACREVVLALARRGLCVTLNSDDPAYFGGYMNDNLRYICCRHFQPVGHGLIQAETSTLPIEAEAGMEALLVQMVKNSIVASFISEERKAAFLAEIDQVVSQH
ncbi:hypothetical protein STCU_05048 [Strigomonas culicis]|nr:hypothetical protein STCU_05048 [Strigomonas culicis]|eukprot:EPY28532.1 hypothetical protein STCU_05048 [Strigomonas culicis]